MISKDEPVRQYGIYGNHGGHVNITDGRYTYMRSPIRPDNTPLFEYTYMPARMRTPFNVNELRSVALQDPFSFTKILYQIYSSRISIRVLSSPRTINPGRDKQ